MNIVFYNTNSNHYDGTSVCVRTLPTKQQAWETLSRAHPDDTFFVVTQLPATFLADVAEQTLADSVARVQFVLTQQEHAADIAAEILALKPDLVIAATFWMPPFDWLGIQDGMIADLLRENGVRTICQPTALSFDCYDKWRTHVLLEKKGIAVPRAIHFSYQQFWSERSHREIRTNVYKDYLLRELQALRYPVVIKDTVGLSSYGMEVAVSYKQALFYLYSGRTNGDRIIEEYIAGIPFGTEIYGTDGNYTVMPPCLFSRNRYGITSPKQSVKIGPVTDARYKLDELNALLLRLARDLRFEGVAQVDLVFCDGNWYVIEINPRLSGMTETYAASLGMSVCELLYAIATNKPLLPAMQCVCNLKLPLLEAAQQETVFSLPTVRGVHQIHNKAAKQKREQGYCEVILCARDRPSLHAALTTLGERYPSLVEPAFLQTAQELAKKMDDPAAVYSMPVFSSADTSTR